MANLQLVPSEIVLGPEMEDSETYSRSCDYCRAMKIRCTRKKPACQRCSKKGISCTRNNPFHKRGPKPKPLYPVFAPNHRRQIRAKSEADRRSGMPFILLPAAYPASLPPVLWFWLEYYQNNGLFDSVPVISQPLLFQSIYASTNIGPGDPLFHLLEAIAWVARTHSNMGPEKFHSAWQMHIAHQDLDSYFVSPEPSSPVSSSPQPSAFDYSCFTNATNLLVSFSHAINDPSFQ
ncbi:hypothetical protein DSO57_1018959 [Entomophthora muscae]|uniref:Uncharacterized protein n=2 Tax=Entomophthora muscae TaxID=34485 RepID=A0ACC2RPL7_9FUNG|nr:hypothetical protein DSO57_1038333 [Entomophthora muscae]KAJ9065508.1 hypothetical protein DSO57_1018959 [Entomophthora muscae]